MHNAVATELNRLYEILGRVPTQRDYTKHHDNALPSYHWIVTNVAPWQVLLSRLDSGMDGNLQERVDAIVAEVKEITVAITAPKAPSLTAYRENKTPGTPKPESVLESLGMSPTAGSWRKFCLQYVGIEPETVSDAWKRKATERRGRKQMREAAEEGDNHEPINLLETLPTDGLLVASSRTVGNAVYHMLR